jgi:two-component system chemotaxis response regulator CheY
MTNERMKILLVDDFSTMRKIIKNLLGKLGYKDIHEADNGATALAKLDDENFDFIIADWNMPKMSGLDLLKILRGDENYKNTPFMMITSEANKNNILEALKAGANDYIVKPFKGEALQEKFTIIFRQLKNT